MTGGGSLLPPSSPLGIPHRTHPIGSPPCSQWSHNQPPTPPPPRPGLSPCSSSRWSTLSPHGHGPASEQTGSLGLNQLAGSGELWHSVLHTGPAPQGLQG